MMLKSLIPRKGELMRPVTSSPLIMRGPSAAAAAAAAGGKRANQCKYLALPLCVCKHSSSFQGGFKNQFPSSEFCRRSIPRYCFPLFFLLLLSLRGSEVQWQSPAHFLFLCCRSRRVSREPSLKKEPIKRHGREGERAEKRSL